MARAHMEIDHLARVFAQLLEDLPAGRAPTRRPDGSAARALRAARDPAPALRAGGGGLRLAGLGDEEPVSPDPRAVVSVGDARRPSAGRGTRGTTRRRPAGPATHARPPCSSANRATSARPDARRRSMVGVGCPAGRVRRSRRARLRRERPGRRPRRPRADAAVQAGQTRTQIRRVARACASPCCRAGSRRSARPSPASARIVIGAASRSRRRSVDEIGARRRSRGSARRRHERRSSVRPPRGPAARGRASR